MFRLFVIVSLISCGLAADDSFDNLPVLGVVGGTSVSISNHPYQISLEYNKRHNCGGSIISPTVIVTAAHCIKDYDTKRMVVRAGSSQSHVGGVTSSVRLAVIHPLYNPGTINYDIGVLFLASALPIGPTIKPIALPANGEALPVNQIAVASGWGATSEGGSGATVLQGVNAQIWDQASCQRAYPNKISAVMLCAGRPSGGQNTCQGDSGGPLVRNGKLYGVVSWAVGCARPYLPSVFAHVINLKPWIMSTIATKG